MARPLVAVVGSLQADRPYPHPVQDIDAGVRACEQVGEELARAGYDLVVFSDRPRFVDGDVVRGYLRGADSASRIHVRAPQAQQVHFDSPPTHPRVIVAQPSPSQDWEMEFFRTILAADGVFLVGGGRGTRTAGIIAAAQRIPLITAAAFGGAAAEVWKTLEGAAVDVTADDRALMGRPWQDDSAKDLVAGLSRQRRQRSARGPRRRPGPETVQAAGALIVLLAAITALIGVVVLDGTVGPTAGVIAAPLLASVAGAMIRGLLTRRPAPLRSAVVGLGAGVVSVLLYVSTQFITTRDLADPEMLFRLALLVTPLGLIAGYTSDKVYASFTAPRITTPQGADPVLEQPLL